MRSPHYFIIKPKGKRYANTKNIGGIDIIVNDNIDDGHYTNREAIVIETPIGYKGSVKKGDTIIVHHNTFRLTRNQRGVMVNSKKHIKEDLFWTRDYYLHIDKENEIKSSFPYVFLKPLIKEDNITGIDKDENAGVLAFNCEETKDKLSIGKKYYFKTGVNAPYTIDNQDYYRVKINSLLAVD